MAYGYYLVVGGKARTAKGKSAEHAEKTRRQADAPDLSIRPRSIDTSRAV
jgi:hypothetical protein